MFNQVSSADEADWLDRLRLGDEAVFNLIYRAHWSSLYSAAYNHLRSRELAEEMVQDLFTALWLKREQLTIHTSLRGYLHTAIRHQIYDYIDKQTVRQRVHADLVYQQQDISHATEQTVAYDELQTHLMDAVGQLPQPAQMVFRLSRYEYLSTQDIARQLNLSPKMVEYHLTRALKLLRVHLKELITVFLLITTVF